MSTYNQIPSSQEDEESGWLTSYADMMTLIACFFILMMAFANYDPAGFSRKTEEISKHFNKDKYKSSWTKMRYLQEEISAHPELKNKMKISMRDGDLTLTFSGSVIFEEDQSALSTQSKLIIDSLVDIIKSDDINYRIIVEGHTSDKKSKLFSSNWSLSTARSASVIERFEYFGFAPENLVATGHADTIPLVPNINESGTPIEENRRMNNRTIIKVLRPKSDISKVKLGFGIYFKDSVEDPQSEGQKSSDESN